MEYFLADLNVLLIGAALLSVIAVLLRQPIVIAYILCGVIAGPWGAGLVKNAELIEVISHLGITLLLFLAGLNLHPQKLIKLFKHTSIPTLINCFVSFVLAFGMAWLVKFTLMESICIGLALMFSSTILTVKLLPTTLLHQERMGAVCISILIIQDLLAIAVLAFIRCLVSPEHAVLNFTLLTLKLILFIGVLIAIEYYILRKVMAFVEKIHEVLFILGLAWCFGIATISHNMGLFYETGAFFAGVVLARHKISRFIAIKLQPIRDFFLVLFFFSLGAQLDLFVMKTNFVPALVLAVLFIIFKPIVFKKAFIVSGEEKDFAKEIGVRLGQLSEFALLIAILGFEVGVIGKHASQFIQLTTIFTFIASSYIVVYKYPTPIGTSERLNRD